ncbi:hypothetical protein ABIE51_002471 [Lysobacter sp. OAE881]|uniref:hypothetical protein n=1 Tax=Lysobacter sp. OAE881 TaxID=2663813 RepID=UPI001788F646
MPIYAGSHRRGAANEVGALGEVIFEEFLRSHRIPFEPRHETTEDLVLFDATVEIKTKDRTVNPLPHYECSVPLYNYEHQRPDLYVFVSLVRDLARSPLSITRFSHAHLVGWATLAQVDQAVVRKRGETDASNGTTFWTSCRNLRIDQLRKFPELLEACAKATRNAGGRG